jgi:ABC-type lipoprotein release transport system permease subunit
MMTFVKLAWRNNLRNPRRSILSISAIATGLAALIFLWSFIDGVNDQMIENSTRYVSGHLQVHRSGYHDEPTLELLLADAGRVAGALAQQADVVAVASRMEGNAIVSAGDKSRGVMVVGINPDEERQVTTLFETVKVGRFLSAGDVNAIMIGDAVADALKVGVGSEVALITQGADGSVGAARYLVSGIFDTRMDMLDGVYVFLPIAAAQQLFSAEGKATSIVARLAERQAAQAVGVRLRATLGPAREVLTWQTLLPNVVQSVQFHEVIGYVLLLVLFVVVVVGVTNTALMAVMERTREFGVMIAVGTRRGQVTRLVFYEACLLGAIGLGIGTLAGVALAQYFAVRGIDLGEYGRAMETMQGLTSVVYPLPRLDRTLIVAACVFATAVLAALFPAWKAASLQPIDAIRGTRMVGGGRATDVVKPAGVLPTLPIFWKIAGRSILRNPRRSVLTIAATGFGLAAFVFLLSFVNGYLAQIVDNSTGYLTGDLQIQHPDFRRDMTAQTVLRRPPELLERIRRNPLVLAAAPRVQVQALVSSPKQSLNVILLGIDPRTELQVTFIDRAVKEGKPLQAGQDREIVLGAKLAEKLGVRVGEKVVLMAQGSDGSLGSGAYRLGGIFVTESEAFDASMGLITLPAAQALLGLGEDVSTIAIRLREGDRIDAAGSALGRYLAGTPYLVVPWRALLPEVAQMIGYIQVIVRLIVAIVFTVVAMGVMNTLLMSVMERTREFGIMMALGTPPRAIVRLVVYESLVLAVVGTMVGAVAGIALVAYLAATGIDLSRYTAGLKTIPGLTGVIFPQLAAAAILLPSSALWLVSMIAGLYPAWRASHLDPVTAIRNG